MSNDALQTLLDLIEGATESSRELDIAIWKQIGLTDIEEERCRSWCGIDGRTDLTRDMFLVAWAPEFTHNQDAAMTLIGPASFPLRSVTLHGVSHGQRGMSWDVEVTIPNHEAQGHSRATAASAICAAALRAWAFLGERH